MRLKNLNNVIGLVYDSLFAYPAPSNLTYFWNFGIYALICLAIQIITGLILAMHYTGTIVEAFNSVEHIMRDVNYGWLVRYIHANGASLFFVVVYVHTFRGIYYGSFTYPKQITWVVGVIILVLMIVTAFMGYVLPWGQMSFWGATVITSVFTAIPVFGDALVVWIWGGFSVDGPTLTRFYSLHFFLPFVITGLVFLHLFLLHLSGSNNPLGSSYGNDNGVSMSPYYLLKDVNGLFFFFIFYGLFIYFNPDLLGHPDNYTQANPLVTPVHIVPEWYFLPFYAILRAVPDKGLGVLVLAFAIISLLYVPFLHLPLIRSMQWRPASQIAFWFLVFTCLGLGWVGSQPIEFPYTIYGEFFTLAYFFYFWFLAPLLIWMENSPWCPSFMLPTNDPDNIWFDHWMDVQKGADPDNPFRVTFDDIIDEFEPSPKWEWKWVEDASIYNYPRPDLSHWDLYAAPMAIYSFFYNHWRPRFKVKYKHYDD